MKSKLIALVVGVALGLLTGAMFNSAQAAEPLTRSERIELLTASTGELLSGGNKVCSLSKLSPGKFLTARHCVKNMPIDELTVRYKLDGNFYGQTRDVMWVTQSRKNDLAIVETETDIEDMKPLTLACSTEIVTGLDVAAMGFPYPMGRYYSEGYVNSVSKTDIDEHTNANFWMDMRIAPGSSGGPVIDAKTGHQIGVAIEIIVPPRVGNIASGAEGISINRLCDPAPSSLDALDKAIEDVFGGPANLEPNPEKYGVL